MDANMGTYFDRYKLEQLSVINATGQLVLKATGPLDHFRLDVPGPYCLHGQVGQQSCDGKVLVK